MFALYWYVLFKAEVPGLLSVRIFDFLSNLAVMSNIYMIQAQQTSISNASKQFSGIQIRLLITVN